MRWPTIVLISIVLSLGVALVAYAQLSDSQTASGTVTVSSTAADLYICEPGTTPGPDCGADDTGEDEAVFEGLENIRPGEIREWDIRLKNTGTEDFLVTGAVVTVVETVDPGEDCPDDALQPVPHPWWDEYYVRGFLLLGKAGDPINDNPTDNYGSPKHLPGAVVFPYENEYGSIQGINVRIAAGDYEDVRLSLQLPAEGSPPLTPTPVPTATASPTPTESVGDCGGNEWSVSFVFEVL